MSEGSGLIAAKLCPGDEVFPGFTVQTPQEPVSPDQIHFTLLHIRTYIKAENMPGKSYSDYLGRVAKMAKDFAGLTKVAKAKGNRPQQRASMCRPSCVHREIRLRLHGR